MTEHHLKTWPSRFTALRTGAKTAEVRLNDRDFTVGDRLILEEWDPDTGYTGRTEERIISHIMGDNHPGLWPGYVLLSFAPRKEAP